MRKTLVGLLAVLVACSLWKLWPEADAADPVPPSPAPVVAEPPPDVTAVQRTEVQPHSGAIGRNVFAFYEAPPVRRAPEPVRERPVQVAVAQPPQPVVEQPVQKSEPPRPIFPYAFIGRFGPDANPIAVFSRDGEIVNARVGEVIGGAWLLTEIGIESVVVNGQRVGLATSS